MKIEQDAYLRKITNSADMVLVDGKPLIWISKIHKHPVKSKISGSDLVPHLCKVSAQKGYRLFIIGGKDGIAEQAKKRLKKQYPDIKIVGTYAPPFGFEKDQAELDKINDMISSKKSSFMKIIRSIVQRYLFVRGQRLIFLRAM